MLCRAVVRFDAMLAEKTVKVLDLVGQGWQVPDRGCPLLLTGGLLAEQLLFPVAQPAACSKFWASMADSVAADLRDLLVEDTHVRSCTHAILKGRQARLDQIQPSRS